MVNQSMLSMELPALLLPSILLSSFLLSLLLLFKKKPSPSNSSSCLVLKSYPILGNIPYFIKNSRRLLEWSTELLTATNTITTVVIAPIVFTINPSNVEYMSKTHFDNYSKVDGFIRAFEEFLGHGIFNTNGEQWKIQRKTASYGFNTSALRSLTVDKVRFEINSRLFPFLMEASRSNRVIDLQDVLERFAFDNICSLVFAYDPDCLYGRSEQGEKFFHAFDEAAHLSVERAKLPFSVIWKLKKLLNVASERRLRHSMAIVHQFVDSFIKARRNSTVVDGLHNDLLALFLEDGSRSDELIRDILISFVLAGRDTTPSALTWFFWTISSRPDVVDKVREEIKSIRLAYKSVDTFSLEELRAMNYLHAAVSESMRLNPAVTLLPRECNADDMLPDGTAVKKGWILMYSVHAMGRTEEIWGKDCMEYKPERWLEDGIFKPKNPFLYPVFHVGPRSCLGKDMAYLQMKGLVASVLEKFDVELMEGGGKYHQSTTLKMEGGLQVRIKERNNGRCQ